MRDGVTMSVKKFGLDLTRSKGRSSHLVSLGLRKAVASSQTLRRDLS